MAPDESLVERLVDLYATEREATMAIEKARGRLASLDCREQLQQFQLAHERHLEELRSCIEELGGHEEQKHDIRGLVLRLLTNLGSLVGDEMALEAAQLDERVMERTLENALEELELPEALRHLLRRHLNEEREHVRWLQRAIEDHLWEPRVPI